MIDILDPGALSTIQDAGRFGLAHLGISPGGAADPVAFAFANRLVGNHEGEAVVEMTLKGGKFRFIEDTVFAIAGADCQPRLDGKPLPLWRSAQARAGQELHCGATRRGARSYLAVRGGFDEPPVLGSRSALISAALGRRLKKDDRLVCPRSEDPVPRFVVDPPVYRSPAELWVIPGRHWSDVLLGEFTVTDHANRSGIRLGGHAITAPRAGEGTSEGVIWGAIQVTGSGQLLVLMNEQQTTGGYPVAGYVQAADRFRLAQLKPGDGVRFRRTDRESARVALREQAGWLARGVRIP